MGQNIISKSSGEDLDRKKENYGNHDSVLSRIFSCGVIYQQIKE